MHEFEEALEGYTLIKDWSYWPEKFKLILIQGSQTENHVRAVLKCKKYV